MFPFFELLLKSTCVIFFKVTKIGIFLKTKTTKIAQRRHGKFALAPRTPFFPRLELANTGYGSSIHFKSINLQYFAIFRDNIIVVNRYIIFKNYDNIKNKLCEKNSFNLTLRFVLEKLLKR